MSLTLPTPRTPDPMTAPPLRWGIIGTGWIAERFVDAMHKHTRQRLVAVGSRTLERAQAFASTLYLGLGRPATTDARARRSGGPGRGGREGAGC